MFSSFASAVVVHGGVFPSQAAALSTCQSDASAFNVPGATSYTDWYCSLYNSTSYALTRQGDASNRQAMYSFPATPKCIAPQVPNDQGQCVDPPKPDLCKASAPFSGWIDFSGSTPGVMCKEGCAYYAGSGSAGAKVDDGTEFRFVGTFEPLGRKCEAGEGSGMGEPGIGDPPPVPPTDNPGEGGDTPGDGGDNPGDGSDKPGAGDKPGDGGDSPGDSTGAGDGDGKGDGTGTGTGPGDGKPEDSDPDKKCTEDWCNVGNADGDTSALYKASSNTPASVYTQFKSQVASSPIASAVSGFFAVNVSGACPSWHIPGNAYWGAAGFDFAFFCQPAFLDILTLAGYIVLATAALCATRIAIY
jgi:hypothetical protein